MSISVVEEVEAILGEVFVKEMFPIWATSEPVDCGGERAGSCGLV